METLVRVLAAIYLQSLYNSEQSSILSFKRRLYYLYFITLLLLELRLQSSELQLLFIRNSLSKLDQSYYSKFCSLTRLSSAQLGCIQLIIFELVNHMLNPVFPAEL